jgi:hypothetical protein
MLDENFWRQASKIYCDDTSVAIVEGTIGDMFLLAMRSGSNTQVFAFTPGHAKRFMQLVAHNVGQYEGKKGKIKVDDWTPGMKAPFQVSDLKGK